MGNAQKKVDVQAQAEPEEKKSLLPEGTPLLSVAGEKLPMSAVGPALEFLEFCTAFYEVSICIFNTDVSFQLSPFESSGCLNDWIRACFILH